MMWDRREALIEEVLEAVVVRLDVEATFPQVRPPMPHNHDEANELPLICRKGAVSWHHWTAEESDQMRLLDEDRLEAVGRRVAIDDEGLAEVQKGQTGADVIAVLRAVKAALASLFHVNPSFFRSAVRGAVMVP